MKKLIEKLVGSVPMKSDFKRLTLNEIVDKAIRDHFDDRTCKSPTAQARYMQQQGEMI